MIDFSQYKVLELRKELKKRGLKRTGKKAHLVARLTKAVNDEAFMPFPKLPAELRRMVWTYALPSRRVVDVTVGWREIGYLGASMRLTAPSITSVVDIMLTSKEAYEVAARRYRPQPTPSWCQPSDPDNNYFTLNFTLTKLNYQDDVFYISPSRHETLVFSNMENYLDPGLIKTVALTMQEVVWHLEESDHKRGWARSLLVCKNVEEIMLIEDLRPAPVKKKPEPFLWSKPKWVDAYSEASDPHMDGLYTEIVDYVKDVFDSDPELSFLKAVKICISILR